METEVHNWHERSYTFDTRQTERFYKISRDCYLEKSFYTCYDILVLFDWRRLELVPNEMVLWKEFRRELGTTIDPRDSFDLVAVC